MLLLSLLLAFVPFIPGLRSIPPWIPVVRLILELPATLTRVRQVGCCWESPKGSRSADNVNVSRDDGVHLFPAACASWK